VASLPERVAAELYGDMAPAEARELVGRLLSPVSDLAELGRCDLVVEAIVESYATKRNLYGQLEEHLDRHAVFASNTSTIPVGRLAANLADPARFCGLHFCPPVQHRPLVEVVRAPRTSDHTVATAVTHVKAIAKMPIVVQDGPAFLVNRLLLPYLGEALELLLEGASIEAVERAATDFGMARGPLRLLDEIGLDTALRAGWVLAEAFPERIVASPLLVAMVKAGRLGYKSGAGFFEYAGAAGGGASALAEQAADEAVADHVLRPLLTPWARPAAPHTPHCITMRLLLPMVLEATRILEENKVRDPRDIDLAVIFGLGFPVARGGLLWWADTLGAARLIEMLRPLERLGPRARPTPLLRELARSAGHFYQTPPAGHRRGRVAGR
jgi:3-hydroxyacyl-CoA dehydrogenase/enoyl-CoA hydratase/3-hydroxybutyryl-CoA epimerase/3-hydroxyacyl-CoA dehydrogenase/enoyl-CoA hydratase/3-hydroxybutyryl-CoA epimerase/enoyl-CoA isomerase